MFDIDIINIGATRCAYATVDKQLKKTRNKVEKLNCMGNIHKKTFLLFTLLILTNCDKVEKPIINSNQIIINAELITYQSLSKNLSEKIYSSSCYPNNWRNGIEFDKENAFFVSAKINNKLLAELSETEAFQIDEMLNENNYSLYGKYLNRWQFIDSIGNVICETDKTKGQKLIEIKRLGEIDEIIIGPIPDKPKKMRILILDSKFYPNNETPEFELK